MFGNSYSLCRKAINLVLYSALFMLVNDVFGQKSISNSGFLDFNAYHDTRGFNVLTINILAKLPHRFQYFSLTNYQSKKKTTDLETFYAEHNVRWGIGDEVPLDLTYQYVVRKGPGNDDHRLGLRWRLNNSPGLESFFEKINMTYSFNPMFLQFREKTRTKVMSTVEHVYKIKILPKKLKNRIYIGGFIDQHFVYNSGRLSFNWVSEHQLGFRILDQFFAVAEYRINTSLESDKVGLGYGLEYKVIF